MEEGEVMRIECNPSCSETANKELVGGEIVKVVETGTTSGLKVGDVVLVGQWPTSGKYLTRVSDGYMYSYHPKLTMKFSRTGFSCKLVEG